MNAHEIAKDFPAVAEDDVPLDLVLARHNLQKLNLASSLNEPHLRACIAHQLGLAEQRLLRRGGGAGNLRHLEEIAAARQTLERHSH